MSVSRDPEGSGTPDVSALVAELEAAVADYLTELGVDPATERDVFEAHVVNALAGAAEFADSKVDSYDFLYAEVEFRLEKQVRRAVFRHQPTPTSLWAFLAGHATAGEDVAVTIVSPKGRRTVADVWPFPVSVCEEMTRPAAPSTLELGNERSRKRMFRLFGYKVAAALETGPPTWWYPRLRLHRSGGSGFGLQAGWFRALIILAMVRADAN